MLDKYKSKYAKKRAQKKRSAPRRAIKPKTARKPRAGKGKYSKKGLVIPTKISNSGGALSCSMWMSRSPASAKVRTIERVGAPNIFSSNSVSMTNVLNGYYGCTAISHLANDELTASVFQPMPVSGVKGPRQAVLESYHSEISFTNNSTAGAECEVYDVVVRKPLPRTNQINVTTSTGMVTYTCSPNVPSYIVQGLAAGTGITPAPASNSLQIGVSPFDSSFFNDYFKVVKRSIVQLTPGASHRHTVSLAPNKLLVEDLVASIDLIGQPGLNVHTLMFYRPYPTLLAGGVALQAPTSETTGSSELTINAITTKRFKYTYVQDSSRTVTYASNAVPNQVATVSTLYGVNPTSGLFQQNVGAQNVPQIPVTAPSIDVFQ